jgi:hypothetical protein
MQKSPRFRKTDQIQERLHLACQKLLQRIILVTHADIRKLECAALKHSEEKLSHFLGFYLSCIKYSILTRRRCGR